MPDLSVPRDATEAAVFSECWDAVLSYADLCTAGTDAARDLAAEAFARGMREARAPAPARRGRRSARLPRIPLLLTAVRATAATWEADGRGARLTPGLRQWLTSERAARWTAPAPRRPLALRALRDLKDAEAELLWLADVEALALPTAARRLGLDPAAASAELAQVRGHFRDHCRRGHLDGPLDLRCRGHAPLLDDATRAPAQDAPDDLLRHLADCDPCAEAAACLRQGAGLPRALASGVLGWGGAAYLERRRRAAAARLAPRRPRTPEPGPATGDAAADGRGTRGGLLLAVGLMSLLTLTVSLLPGSRPAGAEDARSAAAPAPAARPAPAEPGPEPSAEPVAPTPRPSRGTPPRSGRAPHPPRPSGAPSATARGRSTPAPDTRATSCAVRYDLVGQWPDGFQAAVTVTTARALDDWRVAWTFPDGQAVERMWDATAAQDGDRVTALAPGHHRAVRAGGSIGFGFLASWRGRNAPPAAVTLNGSACRVVKAAPGQRVRQPSAASKRSTSSSLLYGARPTRTPPASPRPSRREASRA